MSFDDNNLCLGRNTSKHPRKSRYENTPKTWINVLDDRGTRDPSLLGAESTAGSEDCQRRVERKRCAQTSYNEYVCENKISLRKSERWVTMVTERCVLLPLPTNVYLRQSRLQAKDLEFLTRMFLPEAASFGEYIHLGNCYDTCQYGRWGMGTSLSWEDSTWSSRPKEIRPDHTMLNLKEGMFNPRAHHRL